MFLNWGILQTIWGENIRYDDHGKHMMAGWRARNATAAQYGTEVVPPTPSLSLRAPRASSSQPSLSVSLLSL